MSQLYIEPTVEEILNLRPVALIEDEYIGEYYDWGIPLVDAVVRFLQGRFEIYEQRDNVHISENCVLLFDDLYVEISPIEVALQLGLKDLVCPPSWEQLGFEDFHDEFLSFNPELGTVHNIFLSDPTPLASFDTEIEARKYVYQLQLCQLAKAGQS